MLAAAAAAVCCTWLRFADSSAAVGPDANLQRYAPAHVDL